MEHKEIKWKIIYSCVWGFVCIFSLMIMYDIVVELNDMNALKPDFKLTYYSDLEVWHCEANAGNKVIRSDLHQWCPNVLKYLNVTKVN